MNSNANFCSRNSGVTGDFIVEAENARASVQNNREKNPRGVNRRKEEYS